MIELLVVVAIMTILMGLVLSSFDLSRERSRDNKRISDLQLISLSLEQYKTNCLEYPNRLDASANNGCAIGINFGNFINPIPVDPKTNDPYNYFVYSQSSTNRCLRYHLWTKLEKDREISQNDSNFNSSNIITIPCTTSSGQSPIDGNIPEIYDIHSSDR